MRNRNHCAGIKTVMRDFKLPIENEKTLIEKKTDVAIYREINTDRLRKRNHYADLSPTISEPVSNS